MEQFDKYNLWQLRKGMDRATKDSKVTEGENKVVLEFRYPKNGFKDEAEIEKFRSQIKDSLVDYLFNYHNHDMPKKLARTKLLSIYGELNEKVGFELISTAFIDDVLDECGMLEKETGKK